MPIQIQLSNVVEGMGVPEVSAQNLVDRYQEAFQRLDEPETAISPLQDDARDTDTLPLVAPMPLLLPLDASQISLMGTGQREDIETVEGSPDEDDEPQALPVYSAPIPLVVLSKVEVPVVSLPLDETAANVQNQRKPEKITSRATTPLAHRAETPRTAQSTSHAVPVAGNVDTPVRPTEIHAVPEGCEPVVMSSPSEPEKITSRATTPLAHSAETLRVAQSTSHVEPVSGNIDTPLPAALLIKTTALPEGDEPVMMQNQRKPDSVASRATVPLHRSAETQLLSSAV